MVDSVRRPYLSKFEFVPNDERPNGPFNPWELREGFLSTPPEDWTGFVCWAGSFTRSLVSQKDFVEWQGLVREALIRPATEWRNLSGRFDVDKVRKLHDPLPITFDWKAQTPVARIITGQTLQVVIATVQLDQLQGARFKICARHDCHAPPFRVEARHKIYCSSDCAHLVAVRNSRARAAEEDDQKKMAHKREKSARKRRI